MSLENIHSIFSSSDIEHGIALFSNKEQQQIEKSIVKKNENYFIKCLIRDKFVKAKPEEIIRQLFLKRFLEDYNYPKNRIEIEKTIVFGTRESGFADIVVLRDDLTSPYIIFEVKRPRRSKGLEQLKSYANTEGAPIAIWSNGNEMIRLHREDPNIYVEIPRIPTVTESIKDILTEKWSMEWLEEHNELKNGQTTLKKIILDLEELVLGDSGEAAFSEIFKLIYAKLYDEWRGINDPKYQLQFHVGDRSSNEITKAIGILLDGAKNTWSGIFEPTEKSELLPEHLKVCVSFLEKIMLFHSNLRVIDEAFEYLIPQESKKKQGQFFTPRPVEDLAVKMLNPKSHEFVIDPACGSAGFLLHSVKWIAKDQLTAKGLPEIAKRFAQENIVGIDFARNAVKISKAINLIIGDGKTHIYKDNSLNPKIWQDETKVGLRQRLLMFSDPQKIKENEENLMFFNFDILLTNPPFAGTVNQTQTLRLYQLGEKNGKKLQSVGRHILFIERSLQFLRPGGRMAIVLPQGILSNANTEYIRRFFIEHAKILAVVGLHGNSFKPHTGTKTSVLFLQKYNENELEELNKKKVGFEGEWESFFTKLEKKFKNANWKLNIIEEDIPKTLLNFLEDYFDQNETIEDLIDDTDSEFNILNEEIEIAISQIEDNGKRLKESKTKDSTKIKKEIQKLQTTLKSRIKKISIYSLGGQINLFLNNTKIQKQFKDIWLDSKLIEIIDYPIFYAVNQKPLKNNSGEYIFKLDDKKQIKLDKYDQPIFDHDLNEIAEQFEIFAKKQGFDFF